MRKIIGLIVLGSIFSTPVAASAQMGNHYQPRHATGPNKNYRWEGDDRTSGWDPSRNYRKGNYKARPLGRDDRVYRGRDGRYYCKRNDGTTGLVIGGVGGGVLGNLIAPDGSKTLGTLLGAGAGALLGKSLDNKKIKCQ